MNDEIEPGPELAEKFVDDFRVTNARFPIFDSDRSPLREQLRAARFTHVGHALWTMDYATVLNIVEPYANAGRDLLAGVNLAGEDIGLMHMALLRNTPTNAVMRLQQTLAIPGQELDAVVARTIAPFMQPGALDEAGVRDGLESLLSENSLLNWTALASQGVCFRPAQWPREPDLLVRLALYSEQHDTVNTFTPELRQLVLHGLTAFAQQGFVANDTPGRLNALHVAARCTDHEVMGVLLAHGADPDMPDPDGLSAAQLIGSRHNMCDSQRHDRCRELLQSWRAVQAARQALDEVAAPRLVMP